MVRCFRDNCLGLREGKVIEDNWLGFGPRLMEREGQIDEEKDFDTKLKPLLL